MESSARSRRVLDRDASPDRQTTPRLPRKSREPLPDSWRIHVSRLQTQASTPYLCVASLARRAMAKVAAERNHKPEDTMMKAQANNSRSFSALLVVVLAASMSCTDASKDLQKRPFDGGADSAPSIDDGTPGAEPDMSIASARHVTVNTPMFSFETSSIPAGMMAGVASLRTFGVDFSKKKNADNTHQYVDQSKLMEFIAFTQAHKLEVIWVLNVSSLTLQRELDFVDQAVSRGLNITKFEFGGEFYLSKYFLGELSNKKVVEQIRMDGNNRDYLDLLEQWVPALASRGYSMEKYEYVLICASHGYSGTQRDLYRREWNQKVFGWVQANPLLAGNVSYSFHLYGGEKPELYDPKEEDVSEKLTIESFDFMAEKPAKKPGDLWNNWIVTEYGWYINSWLEADLQKQKASWGLLESVLAKSDVFGIHTLNDSTTNFSSLALYNRNGITPVGVAFDEWLNKKSPAKLCKRWNPNVEIKSAYKGESFQGTSINYRLQLFNNDSSQCAEESFVVKFDSTDGLTPVGIKTSTTVTLPSQGSQLSFIDVQIPNNSSAGLKKFSISIARASNPADAHLERRAILVQ
jgi:hypothetical protein